MSRRSKEKIVQSQIRKIWEKKRVIKSIIKLKIKKVLHHKVVHLQVPHHNNKILEKEKSLNK